MGSKNKVTVNIFGNSYTVIGEESEEYMTKVARYIDSKMSEVSRLSNTFSGVSAATLAALNVADDYFKKSQETIRLNEELKSSRAEVEVLAKKLEQYNKDLVRLSKENETMSAQFSHKENEFLLSIEQLQKDFKEKEGQLLKNVAELKEHFRIQKDKLIKENQAACSKLDDTNKELVAENNELKQKLNQKEKELKEFIEIFDSQNKAK